MIGEGPKIGEILKKIIADEDDRSPPVEKNTSKWQKGRKVEAMTKATRPKEMGGIGLETGEWNKALGEEVTAVGLLGNTDTSRFLEKAGSSA
ncbi:hypothetical protein llap_9875 [Limosa lapponica baueri]|uniref:Uncharacterized protein n=1 Tax=Limosa lapponica baueri TaxID=1758121 RepID=A0A2I0U1C4_LIMLA|nr:hypothetical protein llap_9875 [Limosa lapponica baueri]